MNKEKCEYVSEKKALENLANAVVLQAADDYSKAYMGYTIDRKAPEVVMAECERFFQSEEYSILTEVNSEIILKQSKVRELEKAIQVYSELLNNFRTGTIKVHVDSTKSDAGNKPALNYIIPPRLEKPFRRIMANQLADLRKELEEVQNGTD